MMGIQQIDLEIHHIKGIQNYLADVLNHGPGGLTIRQET
jgi:hypothetical protein